MLPRICAIRSGPRSLRAEQFIDERPLRWAKIRAFRLRYLTEGRRHQAVVKAAAEKGRMAGKEFF